MKRIAFLLVAVATVAAGVAFKFPASERADEKAGPTLGIKFPPGYRDWRLISVAHEAGNLNDIRAILGNDAAIKAYRERKLPFPDGTVIARLAWSYVPSEENNKSLAVNSLSSPGRLPMFSSWSRTPKDTPRPAAGDSLNLKTENLSTRRYAACFPAMSRQSS